MSLVNDPIADMLARIRNAILARKPSVQMPLSKLKLRLAQILQEEGFIAGFSEDHDARQGLLTVQLKWDNSTQCAIQGLRRLSRPGQRRYVGRGDIPRVRSGLGVAILTTSQGIMTDRAARRAKVGGELLCEVW
jgi:small subunit ribosomal protein S8